MTAEIQHELEATRAELRRGVLDLPRETQESTAAMRRVVADQIKALNELTAIVSRSGRARDVALPADAPAAGAPRPRPRRACRAAIRRSRRRAAGRAGAAAAALADAARSRQPRPRRRRAPKPAGSRAALPAPAEAPAPQPAEPAAAAGQGGLAVGPAQPRLARETKAAEVAPRRPTHSIELLDSLSVDIARMIDHDAAVELWDRYKRGERNVFTRRLYTLQGQQTFDEIRRKYRRDPRVQARRSTAMSTSSSGCSPKSPATTATGC